MRQTRLSDAETVSQDLLWIHNIKTEMIANIAAKYVLRSLLLWLYEEFGTVMLETVQATTWQGLLRTRAPASKRSGGLVGKKAN